MIQPERRLSDDQTSGALGRPNPSGRIIQNPSARWRIIISGSVYAMPAWSIRFVINNLRLGTTSNLPLVRQRHRRERALSYRIMRPALAQQRGRGVLKSRIIYR